jgi:hypothetical protein
MKRLRASASVAVTETSSSGGGGGGGGGGGDGDENNDVASAVFVTPPPPPPPPPPISLLPLAGLPFSMADVPLSAMASLLSIVPPPPPSLGLMTVGTATAMLRMLSDPELERQFQCSAFLGATVRVSPLVTGVAPIARFASPASGGRERAWWPHLPVALVTLVTAYGSAGDLVAMESVCR